MPALGQKQTSANVGAMSALPPKADIADSDRHVRIVPKAGITGIQGTTGKWVSNVLLISITFSLVKPPPRRYRLSVSTCAESSPTEKFLILQNRNRPTVKSYFYPAGATVKFYFLRKLDAAYLPHDHL